MILALLAETGFNDLEAIKLEVAQGFVYVRFFVIERPL
jgi:hypothetical protein